MKATFAAFLLASWVCIAQQPGPAPSPAPQNPPQQAEPLGKPIDASPIDPMQPVDIPAEAQAETETVYTGPTILSRGGQPSPRRGTELFRIHPFALVEGLYDTGLVTVGVNEVGQLPYADAYGVQATFGVTGSRGWQRSSLAIDYRGSVRHYTRETYYDGSDHNLLLRYENQVSRRWTVSLIEGASSLSNGMSMPYGMVQTYDPMFGLLTGNELFDSRTNVFLSGVQAVYQHTQRLSFGMGGTGFLVRRRSAALAGADGFTATGDMAYRLSRYSTIGLEYDFSQFEFKNRFGSSNMHGLALNFARRLSRYWEIALRAGGVRVETSRLQMVRLDPAVAAILGQSTGLALFHGIVYLPQYTAQLTRSFRRSSLSAGYSRSISPGNGLYLTSGDESVDISYANQLSHRLALGLGAGATRLKPLSQDVRAYRGYTGRAGLAIRLVSNLSLIARGELRDHLVQNTQLDRRAYRVSIGFGWTPGEYPIAIW